MATRDNKGLVCSMAIRREIMRLPNQFSHLSPYCGCRPGYCFDHPCYKRPIRWVGGMGEGFYTGRSNDQRQECRDGAAHFKGSNDPRGDYPTQSRTFLSYLWILPAGLGSQAGAGMDPLQSPLTHNTK